MAFKCTVRACQDPSIDVFETSCLWRSDLRLDVQSVVSTVAGFRMAFVPGSHAKICTLLLAEWWVVQSSE